MYRSYFKPLFVAVMLCMVASFTVAAKPVISSEKTDVVEAATTAPLLQVSPVVVQTAPKQTPEVVTVKLAPKMRGNSLSIPSIGLIASVVSVGTTAQNAIDVPAGRQVGYWNGSAQPGTPGAAFLDGHVDGIFSRLNNLAINQMISVNYEGQTFNYRVVYREVLALEGIDMGRVLSTYGYASEGLNIMTCAGTYVPSTGTYDHRLVVYAVRV